MTVKQLFDSFSYGFMEVVDANGAYVSTFATGDTLPAYFSFIDVKDFSAFDASLSVRIKEFTGTLKAKDDYLIVDVLGLEFEKGEPAYIKLKVCDISAGTARETRAKLTAKGASGLTFRVNGKKHDLIDVIRY